MAIRSFYDRVTGAVFQGMCPKGFPADVFKAARRKRGVIDAATSLDELKMPPGNRLHPLTNDRAGQHAIGVNDRVRIGFEWTDLGPARVEIVDHHCPEDERDDRRAGDRGNPPPAASWRGVA
ncbi:MAG: type II toxin-antitoxin system RelE/ParE family toxin [Methylobacterium sp.]|nr:type II toxin-antitoxin system RelE/ParE family toxin [Methylobacterium sp.]